MSIDPAPLAERQRSIDRSQLERNNDAVTLEDAAAIDDEIEALLQ